MARQPKEPRDDDSTPDSVSVTSGGGASVDNTLYGIFQRLATIESSLAFITAAVDDTKTKIESIAKDVVETKAKFELLRPIAKAMSKGIWAIFILLVSFGLTVLGMWMKHHFGW